MRAGNIYGLIPTLIYILSVGVGLLFSSSSMASIPVSFNAEVNSLAARCALSDAPLSTATRLSRRCSRSCAGVLLINASSNDAPAQRPSSSRRSMSASIAVADAFVEAYRQVCPRVIVDTLKRKFSPDRSRGILIASALAVASFGIGTGADAHITQIVLGSPTAPFLKTRCRTQRKRYGRSL